MTISAVVLSHNDEKIIQKCLESVSWCDEIILVDDFSADKTADIAKRCGALVYKRHLNSDWAAQRNFALGKAKNEWVLFVDSDEIVSDQMRINIQNHLETDNADGFYLKRTDKFMGRIIKHGESSKVRLLRLAKRKVGKWKRSVHEVWDISGVVGTIDIPLIHDRDFTIGEFIDRLNGYTEIDAQELIKEGKEFTPGELLKPIGKFIDSYICRLGFLDGFPGFVFAFLMSFHSLVVRIKTWEIQQKS